MSARLPGRRRRRASLLVSAIVVGAGLGASAVGGSAAGLPLSSVGLTPYATCLLTATPSTTTVVADDEVRQGNATTNYGTQTTLNIASSGTANRRVYLSFDLSTCAPPIPASATVRLATLRLYVTSLPAVCRTIDIFRVGSAWAESTLTWNNQPFGTVLNSPASTTRTDSFDAGTPTGCENRTTATYLTGATVTADVAAFVANTATNAGWMLRDDVEGSATARTVTFSAKNLGTLAQAPQLVITYVVTP